MRHFEDAMRDIGHDANDILRNIAAKQYANEEFQEDEMAKYAKQQVDALVLTLRPHLKKLSKSSTPTKPLGWPKWTQFLEQAFTAAISVKRILEASKLGPFDFPWPEAGIPIDTTSHRSWFEIPGTTHTLHTFLPAIRRVMPDKTIVFSKAACFPQDSKTNPVETEAN